MKKNLTIVMVLMMVAIFAVTGCSGNKSPEKTPEGSKNLKVGIVQIVEHPSLDTIRENIISQLFFCDQIQNLLPTI